MGESPPGPADEHEAARRVLMRYLLQRVTLRDWHAVSDAANDLRVMEAIREGVLKGAKPAPLTVPPASPSV